MKTHIYIAACTGDGGICHYTQNADGSLNQTGFYPLDRPTYLAIKNNKLFVLLREPFADSEDSGVFSYDIAENGELINPTPIISTKGRCACHLFISDDMTPYCVNYLSGSVIKCPSTLVTHEGEGPVKPRQDRPHTHYVNLTPDGKYVFVTDLGLDTIFTYDMDMNEVSRAKVPHGHGARHLAYSADGRHVFAANELASTVSAFDYNDGILTLKDTASALPGDFTEESTIAAIRVRDGHIYVSNRGHDSIAFFEYSGERLKRRSITKVGGEFPRDYDFIGDFVYSTNQYTNNITVLKYNKGSLELLPLEYSAPNPLAVISIKM